MVTLEMKRFKKWLSGILAVMLLLVCVMPTADVSVNATNTDYETALSTGEDVDYFPYYDEYSAVVFGEKQTLTADMAEVAADEDGVAELKEVTDENGDTRNAVELVKGTMTFKVNVTTAARYIFKLTYLGDKENSRDSSVCVKINGEIPFDEANDITLERLWIDELEWDEKEQDFVIPADNRGNNTIPKQKQIMKWNTMALQEFAIFTNDPLAFYLPAGENTITIQNYSTETMYIAALELDAPNEVMTETAYKALNYKAGKSDWASEHIQAEYPALKSSQSIYPTYDNSNPATEPYDSYLILRNTIGDANWSKPGEWLLYNVDNVPEAGLYYITLKYRQHQVIGSSTFRNIYVNGKIPCDAYENVAFPYNVNWKSQTIDVPVYLEAGHNEIKLQATVGKWADVLRVVEASNQRLNDMYVQIVMVTGTTPDIYYDYNLQKEIPDLIKIFTQEKEILAAQANEFDRLNGGKSTQSETLRGAVNQLESMLDEPSSIPQRLSAFRDTISTLSTWIYDNMTQSLEMDYLMVHGADADLPNPDASFWAKLVHFFKTFIQSFVMDYDMVGASEGGSGEPITVWISSGRDQASIMMDMITEDFTAKTGINVKISLVQTGFIEATLAGTGPDVAVGVARGQPVNLACRGALIDLSQFDTYDDVVSRFSENATVPYEYDGGTYAIPNTQSYFMMFYRKDIVEKLGIELPNTWEDLLHLVPILQKKHMEVGLPYSLISAAAAVDLGMASKDIFPVLLLQNGGDVYNEKGTASTLNSESGMTAFKQWCDYYQQYGFELSYDFYTRFRNGDMPIGIADLGMYNTLIAGAPELRDKWGMAPIPGTVQKDATGNPIYDENGKQKVDRSLGSTGSGVVMFKTSRTGKDGSENWEHRQKCWEFIDWWTQAETQKTYNQQIENVMGPAGRNATANLEAFDKLPWKDDEKAALAAQREWVRDLREVPGSYFVSRCIDNAFRAVIYDRENAREVFNREVQSINREIERKRKELGLELD